MSTGGGGYREALDSGVSVGISRARPWAAFRLQLPDLLRGRDPRCPGAAGSRGGGKASCSEGAVGAWGVQEAAGVPRPSPRGKGWTEAPEGAGCGGGVGGGGCAAAERPVPGLGLGLGPPRRRRAGPHPNARSGLERGLGGPGRAQPRAHHSGRSDGRALARSPAPSACSQGGACIHPRGPPRAGPAPSRAGTAHYFCGRGLFSLGTN